MKKRIKLLTSIITLSSLLSLSSCKINHTVADTEEKFLVNYTFDSIENENVIETISNSNQKVNYVFNESNKDLIFKEPSQALLKDGVMNKALYMDGFSTYISNRDFVSPKSKITFTSWIAPRVFENLSSYSDESVAKGHTRLTSIFNQGDVEQGEGFVFGYGRLGLWGMQLNLHNNETNEDFFVGFYDPINSLPLYEWSFITGTFDGTTGYVCLSYNGVVSYEAIIPELVNCSLIGSYEPLLIGAYSSPMTEYGINRQMLSGLLDDSSIYGTSLSINEIDGIYQKGMKNGEHPTLDYSQIALDSSVYDGDRYRPQYHALPPAVWMNEPHSPFYYKNRYHVFYQHNPSGPYWSQIRWGHLVSDDMIHWEYVKDAVVPTKEICPEGVWTGGAVIGPDGTPWLVITAGTNTSTWSGQNIAFAHCKDPNDPNLTDWEVEKTTVITQPNDNSQGERDQFRDPFVWYDNGIYYMIVSTSIPGVDKGGSGNVYISKNMREWEYKGYLFECDYLLYPEQGAHWECVVMLPITTKDGSKTKYILFDCPQYTVDGYIVDCYYWIGEFDKNACRFIPDDPKPKLFDYGRGVYTGQNGYCFLTEEDKANGKTLYEQGRTVIYAIAQGKDAGTDQNKKAGWAHNFAIPLELYLSGDGQQVIREPIKEIASLYKETLYSNENMDMTCEEVNNEIDGIRGDLLRIDTTIEINNNQGEYKTGLSVRYNPTTSILGTERTDIIFDNNGVYVDRAKSSLLDYVNKQESYRYEVVKNTYQVTILLDRSMLEIYVDGVMSFTTRIYPKYGDSDYLHFFDENAQLKVKSLTIRQMGSAYKDEVTPPYYGNTGLLKEAN